MPPTQGLWGLGGSWGWINPAGHAAGTSCCCSGSAIPSAVPTLLGGFIPIPTAAPVPWLLSGVFGMAGFGMLLSALEMELSSQALPFPGFLPRFINILICLFKHFLECFPCGQRNGCAGIASAAPALELVPRASGFCAGVFGTPFTCLVSA